MVLFAEVLCGCFIIIGLSVASAISDKYFWDRQKWFAEMEERWENLHRK